MSFILELKNIINADEHEHLNTYYGSYNPIIVLVVTIRMKKYILISK